MKPWAQVQAVIDILDGILLSNKPADRIAQEYLRSRRYMGSSDRRTIKDSVFNIIRQQVSLTQRLTTLGNTGPIIGRSLFICYSVCNNATELTEYFADLPHGPARLSGDEHDLIQRLKQLPTNDSAQYNFSQDFEYLNKLYSCNFFTALNQPAPCDVRVNTLKTDRDTVLQYFNDAGIKVEPTPFSPVGIRIDQAVDLKKLEIYQQGFIEVQDEGSQLVSYLCPVESCESFLDSCAGSGGKSLHLSTLTSNPITATDIDSQRLQRCGQRLHRAGISHVACVAYDHALEQQYDCVIIDAPCTGSGTWRRQPDLQAKLNQTIVADMVLKQWTVLQQGAQCVNAGGYLLYITCSFLPEENEQQIKKFLNDHTDFKLVKSHHWPQFLQQFAEGNYLKLSPLQSQTDAFFAALMHKRG